jgi:hypothetical protein
MRFLQFAMENERHVPTMTNHPARFREELTRGCVGILLYAILPFAMPFSVGPALEEA